MVGPNRRGTSLEELRVQIRGQRREPERQNVVEAEAHSVERALKEQDVQYSTMSQVRNSPDSYVPQDSSSVKVRCFRSSDLFPCLGGLTGVIDNLFPEYPTQIFYYQNLNSENGSIPCGQPSTPRGRVALAAVSSVRLFCARLWHHLHSVTPSLSSLFPVRRG